MDVVAWLLGVCGVVGRLPLICHAIPCLAGVPVCFPFLRLLCRGGGAAISSRSRMSCLDRSYSFAGRVPPFSDFISQTPLPK